MYKIVLTCVLCIFSCYCGAQSDKGGGLDLPNGFRVGYQRSDMVNNSKTSSGMLDRGYIGYVRKIGRAPIVHLETGLEFMIAGAEQTDTSKLDLYYFSAPLQGVLKIGPIVAVAGVNANFRIAEKFTESGKSITRDKEEKSAIFDVAADAGIGFNILMITLEARYYWGLLEVDNGWNNRYLQLGLKFHF